MHDSDSVTGPERTGSGFGQRQVALQHVDGVLLEGEDGAIIQHAKEGNQPEAEARQNLANVADLERVVLFFGFASLGVKFLVHKEINDEHYQGDAEQHHAKLD